MQRQFLQMVVSPFILCFLVLGLTGGSPLRKVPKDDFEFSSEDIEVDAFKEKNFIGTNEGNLGKGPLDSSFSNLLNEIGSSAPRKLYTKIYNETNSTRVCWKNVIYVKETNFGKPVKTPWMEFEVVFDFPEEDYPDSSNENLKSEMKVYKIRDRINGVSENLNFTVIEKYPNATVSRYEELSCGIGNILKKTLFEWPKTGKKSLVFELMSRQNFFDRKQNFDKEFELLDPSSVQEEGSTQQYSRSSEAADFDTNNSIEVNEQLESVDDQPSSPWPESKSKGDRKNAKNRRQFNRNRPGNNGDAQREVRTTSEPTLFIDSNEDVSRVGASTSMTDDDNPKEVNEQSESVDDQPSFPWPESKDDRKSAKNRRQFNRNRPGNNGDAQREVRATSETTLFIDSNEDVSRVGASKSMIDDNNSKDSNEDVSVVGASTSMTDDDNSKEVNESEETTQNDNKVVSLNETIDDVINFKTISFPSVDTCSPILTKLLAGNGILPGLCNLKKDETILLKGDIIVSKRYFNKENNTEVEEPLYTIRENAEIEPIGAEIGQNITLQKI